jgi:hypothetical protein
VAVNPYGYRDSNPGRPAHNQVTILTTIWAPIKIHIQGINKTAISRAHIRGCIQKFPDWPPGARPANGTALCH